MNSVLSNDKIKAKTVRVITEDTNKVVPRSEAQQMADAAGLDLIQINDAEIPVVKIADLNKYLYSLNQAEKENKRKQRNAAVKVKEIQISSSTQENDLNVKFKKCKEFLSAGSQVRVVMKTNVRRGSPMARQFVEVLKNLVNTYCECQFVQDVVQQGNSVVCVIKSK